MQKEFLTVQEAADQVGVSASTFKRICDSANIPLIRTPGGHRRIYRMDLGRVASCYLQSRQLKNSASTMVVPIDGTEILTNLIESRPQEIARQLARAASSPTELIAVLEDGLVAALWKVGEMWRANEIDIYQEHICTNTASTALDILRQNLHAESDEKGTAVGGALFPSIESLPSKFIALCFEIIGMHAVDLGGYLPVPSLTKAARDLQAKVVWVTHTHVNDVDLLLENHRFLREELASDVRIIVGGGGLSPAVRRSLPWCEYFETFSQLAQAELA